MKDSDSVSDDFDEDIDEEIQESQFDWLANIYNSHSAINHPSELHGLMVGEIVGSLRRSAADWLNQVLEHMGVESLDNERHANVTEDLLGFYTHSLENIDKDSSSFVLLLQVSVYQKWTVNYRKSSKTSLIFVRLIPRWNKMSLERKSFLK